MLRSVAKNANPPWAKEWSEAIRARLEELRMSPTEFATKLEMSHTRVHRWLDGTSDPPLSAIPEIARITGITWGRQLDLAGYLPPILRSAAYNTQLIGEFDEVLHRLGSLTDKVYEISTSDPTARLASRLMETAPLDLELRFRRAYRGKASRHHQVTYIGLSLADRTDGELEWNDLRDMLVVAGAHDLGARMREQLAHDWPDHPRWVVEVPQHERPRDPLPAARIPAPRQILCIGVPYAHAESIGAALAEGLGYGFRDTRHTGGLLEYDSDEETRRHRVKWFGHQLQHLPEEDGWILASGDHHVLSHSITALENSRPALVIYVRLQPRMLARASEVWSVEQSALEDLQHTLDDLVARAPWPAIQLQMLDERVTNDDQTIDRDAVADHAVILCALVVDALARRHAVPRDIGRLVHGELLGPLLQLDQRRWVLHRHGIVSEYRIESLSSD